jgi:hypothetical protein
MNSLLSIAALIGVTLFSFVFGVFAWFVVYRSSSVDQLRRIREVFIVFALLGICLFVVVGIGRYLFIDAVRSDPEQRMWLFLSPCFFAAIALAQILALNWRIRRLNHAA